MTYYILRIMLIFLILSVYSTFSFSENTASISGMVNFNTEVITKKINFIVIKLIDVTRVGKAAKIISSMKIKPVSRIPVTFSINYNESSINPENSYIIFVEVYEKNKFSENIRTFITTQSYPVLTHTYGNKLDVIVSRINQ